MFLGRRKLIVVGLLILIVISSLFLYFKFFQKSKELKPVSYKDIELRYGEYKPTEFAKTTYTGTVSNIKKFGVGNYLFLEVSSSQEKKEYRLYPSQTLVTILKDPNQNETVWKIYKLEELLDIIKVGSTITLRYDDEQAGKYAIIIHSYVKDQN